MRVCPRLGLVYRDCTVNTHAREVVLDLRPRRDEPGAFQAPEQDAHALF